MTNKNNLVPIRSTEEARKRGRNGGIKSGQVRREKRLFRETIEKKLGKNINSMIDSMIAQAQLGNVQAITFLRDTVGEKPTDRINADIDGDITINIELSDDE